jgi:pimeloyl-ACP methyl ester carboxylesterase
MGMKRLLAAAAAAGLVAVGAVASDAQADPVRGKPGYTPSITWGQCENAALQARNAECGFLAVPLDYGNPSGTKIKLAVSRVKHTTTDPAQYQGVMLVNPGGPGGSGFALSVLGPYVPDHAGDAYDWIGFDPRGVGASQPALACDGTYDGYRRPPYVPVTAALEKTWLARTTAYAKACDKAGGALLDHLKTTDSAKDMESLRRALGVERINFYGFSYGTYLGQVYATLYPDRVRRMVLDGNVNPGRVWYDANLDQDIAFDRNIKIYFGWLAKYDSVYHLGKTAPAVEKLFYATQAKLAKQPAGAVIGPDELTDVFLQAGYYIFGWHDVASAFSRWVNHHDAAQLKALYDRDSPQKEGADNGYAIYLAVQCTDVRWPASWAKWKADNWRIHRRAPFETWGNAWYNAPCLSWGAKPGKPVRVDGRKVPPVLLISETLDAATPYSGSLEVRKRFPRSALIEGVGGTTHAGSLFGNSCVDKTIAAYLASGALPKRVKANRSDKKCKPLPRPVPTAAAATSSTAPGGIRRTARRSVVNTVH